MKWLSGIFYITVNPWYTKHTKLFSLVCYYHLPPSFLCNSSGWACDQKRKPYWLDSIIFSVMEKRLTPLHKKIGPIDGMRTFKSVWTEASPFNL